MVEKALDHGLSRDTQWVCVCAHREHPRSLEGQDAKMASLLWLPFFHLCAYFPFLLSDLLSGSASRMHIIPPALARAASACLSSSLPSWGFYISYQLSGAAAFLPVSTGERPEPLWSMPGL